MQRAVKNGIVSYRARSFRSCGIGNYRAVDDYPFGGGPGMLMRFDVINKALSSGYRGQLVMMSPRGQPLSQGLIKHLGKSDICLLCGHYEGIDQRVSEAFAPLEISLGDYILNGGELAACVIIEAVSRLLANYMGNANAIKEESFDATFKGLLEEDQYTRPRTVDGFKVPQILISGHREKIAKWKRINRLFQTWKRRPDIISKTTLNNEDISGLFEELENKIGYKRKKK